MNRGRAQKITWLKVNKNPKNGPKSELVIVVENPPQISIKPVFGLELWKHIGTKDRDYKPVFWLYQG